MTERSFIFEDLIYLTKIYQDNNFKFNKTQYLIIRIQNVKKIVFNQKN